MDTTRLLVMIGSFYLYFMFVNIVSHAHISY